MTFLQIGVPLGVVLGYVLTSLIKDLLGWTYAFIIQSIMTAVLLCLTLFVPLKYFSATHHAKINKKNLPRHSVDTVYYDSINDHASVKGSGVCLFFKKCMKIFTYKVRIDKELLNLIMLIGLCIM